MKDLIDDPIHPGEVLSEVYMKSVQPPFTVHDLAKSIDVPPKELANFLAGHRSVTMPLAARLAMTFRTTIAYWLGLQALYNRRHQLAKPLRVPHQTVKKPNP